MKSTADVFRDASPNGGFTLIELVIVVTIIGIIAAIAYPSYKDSVRKGRRAEATGALSEAASRLQQYYMDNKGYPAGGDMTDIGYGGASFSTPEGHYQVGFSVAATATTYSLQAVPQNDQANDLQCGTFTINQLETRGVTGPAGVGACW